MQDWMNHATNLELWVVGGILSIAMWLGVIFPLIWRTLYVPLGGRPFWTRMGEKPAQAIALTILLFCTGPFMVVPGFACFVFFFLFFIFKGLIGLVFTL